MDLAPLSLDPSAGRAACQAASLLKGLGATQMVPEVDSGLFPLRADS
jgi:hypothetical protein